MKRKIKFETPTVLQAVDLSLEGGILLKGSIVDQVEVISAGQEVHDLDAESPEFEWNDNWNWED
jgi:hypothetical protein